MAEAVAALGLAASIIQFVDFGSRVAKNIWDIHESQRNAPDEIMDIALITTDLQQILVSWSVPDIEQPDSGLVKLATECQRQALELQKLLWSLQTLWSTRTGKREALKAALKATWKDKDVKAFQSKLNQFRCQLTVHLLHRLR